MTAAVGPAWVGGRTLLTRPAVPLLDLDSGEAQRQATFRFEVTDDVTGVRLGDITPIRSASLSHDTGSTIKRQLDFPLGVTDTRALDMVVDRISVFMVIPGATNPDRPDGHWPLGRYMFVDPSVQTTTAGPLASARLSDEMFLVDQEILTGISGFGFSIIETVAKALAGLPVKFKSDPTTFASVEAWGVGINRGRILEALSISGDYFSPWFDNEGFLRFIRTVNPAKSIPDMNLDIGARVIRGSITQTSDLLNAPNTVLVIGNGGSTNGEPLVGIASLPPSAATSVSKRGFPIVKSFNMPLSDQGQADAVAQGLIERMTIVETVTLSTAPDPRHDSYNVIRWQGENWLELGWSMPLVEGASMMHTLRRGYS